ncbi:FAD-binding domain-containing protein [Annulohypoxylon moriforme]|nr:FAD-binding domain-containing protein [Annulohypoxylon moriforme]
MSVAGAIEAARQISGDLVVLPGAETYNELTKSYFSELERELKPACFLTPSSPAQVADIIKAIKPLGLLSKVAICGAGQQATPGVANVRDGLTIHLKNLRGITLDPGNKYVSVAAGEKMGDVYEAVIKAGLGVVGNRHSTGGIGGDAVQGGLSYFSYRRGFVCDNVVNYEVVLASGEIVNANAETNTDLWVALKGGGSNFGIVTRFDLSVFEQGQLWGGKVFYFQPSFSGQIQSLVDYLHDPEADNDVHICLSLGYAGAFGDFVCMNDVFCTRPEKPKALEPFADIEPQIDQMKSLRIDNLKNLTTEAFAGAPANRVLKMSTTVKADADILEYSVKAYHTAFEKLKQVQNILFSITFEPIPVSLVKNAAVRGKNALGLGLEDVPLVVVLFYTSWDNASDDELVYDVNKSVIAEVEKEAQSKNVSASYRYLNYASPHQGSFDSYGPESKAQLLKVSAKYDPDGFFQTARAGPFKLQI